MRVEALTQKENGPPGYLAAWLGGPFEAEPEAWEARAIAALGASSLRNLGAPAERSTSPFAQGRELVVFVFLNAPAFEGGPGVAGDRKKGWLDGQGFEGALQEEFGAAFDRVKNGRSSAREWGALMARGETLALEREVMAGKAGAAPRI